MVFNIVSYYRIIVIAGDFTPIDLYCHIPAICEEKEIPYIYVPAASDMGNAVGIASVSIILIKSHDDYQESYDKVLQDIQNVK